MVGADADGTRPDGARSELGPVVRAGAAAGSVPAGEAEPAAEVRPIRVIVVDDHITGVLSEHQAGKCLDVKPTGIRVRGRRSTPGRYFQVAHPGTGWGGTDITDPLAVIERIDPKLAWPGLRLLLTSTTGEDHLYVELDEALRPVPVATPAAVLKTVENKAKEKEGAAAPASA